MRAPKLLPVLLLACLPVHAASLQITPTTTLAAETANNTSAAATFTTQSDGNLGAGNVSKLDHRTLLYPGATTQIFTNIMYWFGPSNHIQVGYNSGDPTQVQRQVDDHLSRGINGTIVDWYGPGATFVDGGTLLMKQYAESLPGYPFKFAIMEDKGALGPCAATPGCDLNAQLISDLTYIYNTYGVSPAYLHRDGRPVVFFFGLERYAIDWDYVTARTPGNPLFIFQNPSGYWHADTGGAFAWVQINTGNPNDWEQSYLDYFYSTALSFPGDHTYGATYKGFNDTLASWSLNRVMNQNCGQTWLNTWNEVGRYFSTANQLEAMQIVTWNDYEEGTEMESGIDNCVSLSGSISGSTLSWAISGGLENTIDHYVVFISSDGEGLMPLASVGTGIHALNLATFNIAPGSYTLYVKAVGKPSMANQMSGAVYLTVPNQPPTVVLAVTPIGGLAPLSVTASTAGSSDADGVIAASSINFGDGTVAAATAAQHTYNTAGRYTISAVVTDDWGVSSATAAPVTAAGVAVATPLNGAIVSSLVRFVASAYSTLPVTAMRIYVDSVSYYTVYAASLDTYVSLSAGSHYLIVQAWDSSGAVFKTPVTVNVLGTRRLPSTR